MEKNYLIFHSPSENTVRVTVVGIYEDGVLRLSASRCSEKDHFSKKTGREIAIKRFESGEFVTEFTIKDFIKLDFYEIAELVSISVIKFGVTQKIEIINTNKLLYVEDETTAETLFFSVLDRRFVFTLIK